MATLIHPVATWHHHEITGLPMCWLFGEYDTPGAYFGVTFDGAVFTIYEGNKNDGPLPPVQGVEVYGKRQEDPASHYDPVTPEEESGVKIIVVKDSLIIRELQIDSSGAGVDTYSWPWITLDRGIVDMLRATIEPSLITITPDGLLLDWE